MNPLQAKQLAQRLAEFFPGQLKPAEKMEAIRRFTDLEYAPVERLIGERWHLFKRDPAQRLKLDELLTALQSEVEKAAAGRNGGSDQSWCATQRRNDRTPNKSLRGEKSDHAMILRVYGALWHNSEKSDGYRSMLRRQCIGVLVGEARLTPEAAEADADLMLTDVETLKPRLAELRGELPSLSGAQ